MRRAFLVLFGSVLAAFAQERYDLVVYGGTAGGVMTAVSGAREGLKVVLLEPGAHLGGMATGGLSRTDFGKKEVIGGFAPRVFLARGGEDGDSPFPPPIPPVSPPQVPPHT